MEQNVNNNERLFLEEVTLSGYKSIYNTNITFNKGINIIIGKNAVGKTNFFSFLFKIINLLYKDLYNFQSTLLLKNGSKLQINAKNYIPLDAVRLEKLKNIEDKNTIPLFGEGIFDTNTFVQLDGKFIINDFIERNIYLALLNNNIWYNPTFLKHGIPQNVLFIDNQSSFSVELDKLLSNIMDIEFPSFIKSILSDFLQDEQFYKETDLNLIKYKIRTALGKIDVIIPFLKKMSPISDVRINENYNISPANGKGTFSINNLFYEFLIEDDWYPFNSLSDGAKRLFYIIAEVAFNGQSYFSKFGILNLTDIETNRIILIEEPELGIHPHQLNELMLFLKEQSKKKQIIITTHSPQVLDILNKDELGNIIIASYEKDKGTLLRHLDDAEITKAQTYMEEDYLSDYWRFSDLEKVKI